MFNPREEINKRNEQFVYNTNSLIMKGNQIASVVQSGRLSNPMVPELLKSNIGTSQQLGAQYCQDKKDLANGKISLPDFKKKLNTLYTLIKEGYFADPTNAYTNEIINDYNASLTSPKLVALNAPQPMGAEPVVVKATSGAAIHSGRSSDPIIKSIEKTAQDISTYIDGFIKHMDEIREKSKRKWQKK